MKTYTVWFVIRRLRNVDNKIEFVDVGLVQRAAYVELRKPSDALDVLSAAGYLPPQFALLQEVSVQLFAGGVFRLHSVEAMTVELRPIETPHALAVSRVRALLNQAEALIKAEGLDDLHDEYHFVDFVGEVREALYGAGSGGRRD